MGILRADLLTHSQLESAGGSVVLDGTGDYLTIPNHSAFHFTGDYTIDFYIKFTTNSGTQRIFGQRNADASDISVLGEFASNNFLYYYSQNGSSTVSLTIGTYGTNIELNTWHHVAIVCDGGVHHSYLDGVQTSVNANNPPPLNDGDSTWSIGRQGAYTANEFNGSIYGFRITNKALYKNNFTLSKFKPKVLPETTLLCCVSSTSVTEKEVSVAGDITSNGDPQVGDTPLLKEDTTDTGVVFDGFGNFATSTYMVPPSGKTTERNRGRAVFGGGANPSVTDYIDYVHIPSGGNAITFGNLINPGNSNFGLSSSTRGIWAGGRQPTPSNIIEYITLATTSNTTDFGDLTQARHHGGSASNSTRGVFMAGGNPSGLNVMDYVTIATTGNATDFGDTLTTSITTGGGRSSSTRGILAGLMPSSPTIANTIEFITIATTGNSQDFGDLTQASRGVGAGNLSSGTRAVLMGGYTDPAFTNVISFVTIASVGNATDFGDISSARGGGGSASTLIKGVLAGGRTPTDVNTIDAIIIATTGNSTDFGDLTQARAYQPSGCSDSHGGLS